MTTTARTYLYNPRLWLLVGVVGPLLMIASARCGDSYY